MAFQPAWDIDRNYGEDGEQTVRDLLGLSDARIEVKRKRYADDRFYVEIAQRLRGSFNFVRSGINTSKADYFAYVIADTGVLVFFPRKLLKEAARRGRDVAETDGDNPTKGKLVTFDEILRQPWREDDQ